MKAIMSHSKRQQLSHPVAQNIFHSHASISWTGKGPARCAALPVFCGASLNLQSGSAPQTTIRADGRKNGTG